MTLDSEILSALRSAGERALANAELAHKLGVSRLTLTRRVDELRSLGYEIESSPHRGYRLLRVPDVLHADDLLSRLGKVRVIGRLIQVFQETTSTNDVIEKLARGGVKEGIVAFAESQTRGRGRLGRKWLSPAGKGLWFSVLLRPSVSPEHATQITIAAATALARAIRTQTQLRPEIKWPNDVLIGGKKVAGVLTELRAEGERVTHVILGVGINVNLTTADFPPDLRRLATSLKLECGHGLDRAELAAGVLRELDRDYTRVTQGAFDSLVDEWESHCSTLGSEVTIQIGRRQLRGRAESLDANGALLVRTHHGHLERVNGGDVSLEK